MLSLGQGGVSGLSTMSPVERAGVRPRPTEGRVDWVQRQREEALTPCVGCNSGGDEGFRVRLI